MKIDPEFLQKTLFDLIAIPSVNPSLAGEADPPAARGETAIAGYLAEALAGLGLQVERLEAQPGRPSLLGVLPGRGGGRSLMWNGHTDTVGAGEMVDPCLARLENGRVYGRGAQDMKGSLAAMLAAAQALAGSGSLAGDLLLAFVADEEFGSLGTQEVIDHLERVGYRLDGALVTEPTELIPAAAHRGYAWLEVETRGQAAHGSRWWEGRDANRMMGRVLGGLGELADALAGRPPHPLVGPPSLHTPLIRGGSEMSIYAARCRLQIERRTVPGETPQGAAAEIQAVLDRLAQADEDFQASLSLWLDRPPFEARPDSQLQPLLLAQAEAVLGRPVEVGGIPFWTDAALLARAGAEVNLIGPSGGGLHTGLEWVELDSCLNLAEILVGTARAYCA
jgi:acetylornithine deacetylase